MLGLSDTIDNLPKGQQEWFFNPFELDPSLVPCNRTSHTHSCPRSRPKKCPVMKCLLFLHLSLKATGYAVSLCSLCEKPLFISVFHPFTRFSSFLFVLEVKSLVYKRWEFQKLKAFSLKSTNSPQ